MFSLSVSVSGVEASKLMIEPMNNPDKEPTEYKSSPLKEDTGSTRNLGSTNDGDNKHKGEENNAENQNMVAENEGDNENKETDNSEENTSGISGDNGESSKVGSYGDNKSGTTINSIKGLEQIYLKHQTEKTIQAGRKHNAHSHPSTPNSKQQRYGLTKHELKSLINDDQAIEMKQRYGNNRVVLDFSKGNDDAKIIVYDDKHPSIEKRDKIRKILDSPAHSLASEGTENEFIGRLQKERAAYRAKKVQNGTAKTRPGMKTGKANKKSRSRLNPITKKKTKKIVTGQSKMKSLKKSNANAKLTGESSKKSVKESTANAKLTGESSKKSVKESTANAKLTKEAVQEVNSTKRGMMMTQHDKQECGLLSK